MERVHRTMISFAITGALIYVSVVGGLAVLQRDLLFRPSGLPASPAAAAVPEMRPVAVRTADALEIVGWYAPPPSPGRPVVVLYHGNAGHLGMRAFKARAFLDAGFGVWLAGYRGYGGNPGSPSEEGLYADARAALDHLAAGGIGGERVVLYGESLGTGVAVQMATERPVGAVVLEAPYTTIPDVAAGIYPFAPVHLLARDRFDSIAKISRIGAPLLVLHGERDRVVPIDLGRRLFEAAVSPKRGVFLPQPGHNDLYDWGALEHVLGFLTGTQGPLRQ